MLYECLVFSHQDLVVLHQDLVKNRKSTDIRKSLRLKGKNRH